MALILVTGASTGLGQAAAAALARDGHEVVVHARDESRWDDPEWAESMRGTAYADLADADQTVALAEELAEFGQFDAVIHNAGVMAGPITEVNVVASYLLSALLPRPKRCIVLSSGMHRGGSTDLHGLRGKASYSDSKLWVTALTLGLARRRKGTAVHAVDPGWVPTRMGGMHATDDLAAGHETQVWLATADHTDPPTGGYWYHRRTQRPHHAATDQRFQDAVVAALQQRTGVTLD